MATALTGPAAAPVLRSTARHVPPLRRAAWLPLRPIPARPLWPLLRSSATNLRAPEEEGGAMAAGPRCMLHGERQQRGGVEAVVKGICCSLLMVALGLQSAAAMDSERELAELFRAPEDVAEVELFVRAERRPDLPMIKAVTDDAYPDQVHVSLAGPNRVRISWVTQDESAPSLVEYGTAPDSYDREAVGESFSYRYLTYSSGQIHHAVLGSDTPLGNDTVYYYRCGGTGPQFSFKTPPALGPDTPIKIHLVGDLGQTGWSVSTLEHMKQREHDLVILAGDLSYADRYQPRWDTWGRLIEPLASTRPWMVVEGNHEIESVWGLEPPFLAYNTRWPMPHDESGSSSNLFYSFETANAHFIMLGSYADYSPGSEQYKWLQTDLAKVDRKRTPWLIAVQHAPWYNSNSAHQHEADGMMGAMEDLLYAAKVDFLFSGHVHAYERSSRAYKGASNPCGIVHITIGDGGNREGLASRYIDPKPEWSVMREASFGHGELELLNGTTAMWSWHRNQDDVAVVADETWVQSLGDPNHVCSRPDESAQPLVD